MKVWYGIYLGIRWVICLYLDQMIEARMYLILENNLNKLEIICIKILKLKGDFGHVIDLAIR